MDKKDCVEGLGIIRSSCFEDKIGFCCGGLHSNKTNYAEVVDFAISHLQSQASEGRLLPCKNLVYKTINGELTELFIDCVEFVKKPGDDLRKELTKAICYLDDMLISESDRCKAVTIVNHAWAKLKEEGKIQR